MPKKNIEWLFLLFAPRTASPLVSRPTGEKIFGRSDKVLDYLISSQRFDKITLLKFLSLIKRRKLKEMFDILAGNGSRSVYSRI